MTTRDLLAIDGDGAVLGSVVVDETGRAAFVQSADHVFARLRDRLGWDKAGRTLIEQGWSNGKLYLGEAREDG